MIYTYIFGLFIYTVYVHMCIMCTSGAELES